MSTRAPRAVALALLAVWSLAVSKEGTYRVELDYACQNNTAGNPFLLEVAGQKLSGRVEGTGTWDNYRRKQIGTIHLAAGASELLFHSAGPIKQHLIDLRGIRLVPVK